MRKKKVNLQKPINAKIFQDFTNLWSSQLQKVITYKQISIPLFMNTKAQMSGRWYYPVPCSLLLMYEIFLGKHRLGI